MQPFSTINNTKNGTEQDGPFFDQEEQKNGTEHGWNDWKKNERERNNLAGGHAFQNGTK